MVTKFKQIVNSFTNMAFIYYYTMRSFITFYTSLNMIWVVQSRRVRWGGMKHTREK